jgi:hypothetical protein
MQRGRLFAEIVPLVAGMVVIAIAEKRIAMPALIALILLQRTISDGSLVPVHPESIAYPRLGLFRRWSAWPSLSASHRPAIACFRIPRRCTAWKMFAAPRQ